MTTTTTTTMTMTMMTTTMKLLPSTLAVLFVLAGLTGCGGGGGDDEVADSTGTDSTGDTGTGVTVDEAAIMAEAVAYSTNFTKMNVNPIASQHAGGIDVNIWVKPPVDNYRSVDPENPSALNFAPETLIVKEHLDGMGAPTGMTIMYKAIGGFDPDNNDWWWGAADLDGNLMASGAAVDNCIGCHADVALTDYVYGIPLANQVP